MADLAKLNHEATHCNRYSISTLDNATDKTGNSNQVIGSIMIMSTHQQYWLKRLFLGACASKFRDKLLLTRTGYNNEQIKPALV